MSFCEALFRALAEFIFRLAFVFIISTICVVLGEIIAAHQNRIMSRTRQLQTLFHLPTWTHIFSEADTQIHHDDIKSAAIALTSTTVFVTAGVLDTLKEGPKAILSRPRVVCGLFGLSVTPVLLLWLHLALTCRRRRSNRMAVAWDIEDVSSTDDPEMERGVCSNENTALLIPAEKIPEGEKEYKEGYGQMISDGPSEAEVDTIDERRHVDGRSDSYTLQVSWTPSELPFVWSVW